MDPGQLRSAFLSNFNRLKNALEQNGLWADVQKKLHDSGAIEVKVNKHFTNGHRTAFALRIGDSRGKVWACIDGKVIDEDGYDSAQAEEIDKYTKRQIRLCQWNTWPASFKRDIYGPFGSENLALVRFDIARWAVLRQSNHISYGDSIQPNLQDLTEALRKYRPANFGSRPNPAGLPLPFRQYKFSRTNSQSVSKDNSDAKATGRALDPQQSDELQNEKTPNIADNRVSVDELSPINDVNDVNDIEEAISEDCQAAGLHPLRQHAKKVTMINLNIDHAVQNILLRQEATLWKTLRPMIVILTILSIITVAVRQPPFLPQLYCHLPNPHYHIQMSLLHSQHLINRSKAIEESCRYLQKYLTYHLGVDHTMPLVQRHAAKKSCKNLKDMAEVSHSLTAEQAERDKLVARMTKKQIPAALQIAKERQTALYRRIDQAFARSDRQDELTNELLEMVAGTATGQTGTGDEEDERGEEMPKHSDGHSDNYMGE
ncbi:hypothetical protein SNOG_09382 [Parastagonospora nodorum SN15]|uniref:Uncharacterized protein n=1 Tax=Phaeosphaeria nodorum (strain SN15 / ATCC MYA-4574 / FGSC 10173) TaxID=321614 RepID=Q0UFT2_PHANO|nr:hypothetical protein SNOG_09382 [Parastagonospora nodorum SN15]EAT83574.2 hypothetical protein SNOG_09382 [Parastagonospora nodorum SN15]